MKGHVPAAKRNMSNGIKLSAILQSIRRNSNWPGFTRLKHEEGYLCRKAVTSVSNATNLTRPDKPICSRWRVGRGSVRRSCNVAGQRLRNQSNYHSSRFCVISNFALPTFPPRDTSYRITWPATITTIVIYKWLPYCIQCPSRLHFFCVCGCIPCISAT